MPRRRPPSQPSLPLGGKRYTAGVVERAASGDLKMLRDLEMMAAGTDALAAAYRHAAREVDRAEKVGEAWTKLAAIRELRQVRAELAPMTAPMADDELEQLLAVLTAEIRDAAQP